mmetsp:Transcript_11579/g.38281  ORF Transcript_11579/g.38281 Transcript_11579/m.38281 type:complete len:211 (-) Transcript_11579:530-1162(-)
MRAWKAGAAVWRCSRSASETCSESDFRIVSSCCSLRMKSRSWLTVCAACRSSCPSCTSRDSFCSSGPMSPKLRLRSCAYSASELLSSRFTGMPGGRPSSSGSTSITPCRMLKTEWSSPSYVSSVSRGVTMSQTRSSSSSEPICRPPARGPLARSAGRPASWRGCLICFSIRLTCWAHEPFPRRLATGPYRSSSSRMEEATEWRTDMSPSW